MHLAAGKLWKLAHGLGGCRIPGGGGGEGDQQLVRVQPGIFAAQILCFQVLDGLDGGRRNHPDAVGDAREALQGV